MEQRQVLSSLKRMKPDLAKKYPLVKLGIFGSLAKNAHTEHSDIDIVVELNNPKMFDLIGIKQDIEEHLKKKVDIVRYRKTMNKYLKRRIESDAKYV